jgi:succinate dehydrogenase / fumarate reductase iron-sulfur subunit
MIVKTYRYAPESGIPPRFQSFEVPAGPDWTVMDILDYISLHQDSSLAYFRHSACDHGVCARCGLKVNGKPVLACTYTVGDAVELILEPRNDKVVRDLVTL